MVVATSSAFLTPVVWSDPPWQFCKAPEAKPEELSAWNLDGNNLKQNHAHLGTCDVELEGVLPNCKNCLTTGLLADL